MLNFDFLVHLSEAGARSVFLVLYGLIVVLVWLLRNEYIYRDVAQPRVWHNLKIWATLVMALLALLYLYF